MRVRASPSAPAGSDGGAVARAYGEVEAEVGFAGDADLAADQPAYLGVEVDGAGFEFGRRGEEDGEGYGVFVAEVHERAQRQAAGDWELHGAGGEAGGEGPGDLGWLAGVAGVDPVDVPVLFEGEDETELEGSAGSDGGGDGDELGGEVLGLDGAGAAVADGRQLRVRELGAARAEMRLTSRTGDELRRRMFM